MPLGPNHVTAEYVDDHDHEYDATHPSVTARAHSVGNGPKQSPVPGTQSRTPRLRVVVTAAATFRA